MRVGNHVTAIGLAMTLTNSAGCSWLWLDRPRPNATAVGVECDENSRLPLYDAYAAVASTTLIVAGILGAVFLDGGDDELPGWAIVAGAYAGAGGVLAFGLSSGNGAKKLEQCSRLRREPRP